MIHAARKRRELARSCGAASGVDFMSLKQTSDTSQKCDQVGDHDDDDDDDNSDEGASKVRQFGIRPDATKQMLVLSAMDNAESGSDEEKFEKQQINKGTHSFPVTAPSDCSQCVAPVQYEETILMPPLQGAAVSTEAEPEFMLTPISVESLQSQLQSQLSHVQDQRSLNNASITKLREDLAAAHNEIETMESRTLNLAMRYEFYQEMRGYIKDLLLCLTEKIFSLLPWSWWRAGILNGHHFSGMLRYIVNLIEILQKSLLTEPECNRQDLRDSIRQAKVLLRKASQGPTEESKPRSY